MSDMCYIYCLVDPRSEDMRYVGRTTNPSKRLQGHIQPSRLKSNTHKNNWIKSILREGAIPRLDIVQELRPGEDVNAAERWWIGYFIREGWDLTNSTLGGEGLMPGFRRGFTLTEASRKKIGDALRGRKQDPVVVAKRSASCRGRKRSDAFCESMRGTNSPRSAFTTRQVQDILNAVSDGESKGSIADRYGVHVSTIYRVVKRAHVER